MGPKRRLASSEQAKVFNALGLFNVLMFGRLRLQSLKTLTPEVLAPLRKSRFFPPFTDFTSPSGGPQGKAKPVGGGRKGFR